MSPNITALILLIASAGAVFGLINPQYAKYQVLSESKAQYQTAADQAKKVREVREKLISSASNISSLEKDRLTRMLPDTVDTVRLTTDITSIASKYGILIKRIDAKPEDKKANSPLLAASPFATAQKVQNFSALPISFILTTSYESFSRFLVDLEKSLRIIDVVSISVTPNAVGQYDFSVAARTYAFVSDTALTPANQSTGRTSAKVGKEDPKAKVVEMLSRLSSLKLERAFFDSPLFKTLQDFGVEVVVEPKGRPNPFAPIGQ
ncbi:MAG: type 4a pilus biogenesis protein PilO [Patescibacteria group bacterium]